jgi:hypothetical protein
VALLRKQLAKGEKEAPTKEEIDAALKQMPPDTRSFGSYAAGRFLQTRGQKELATEYLKQCIAGSPSANTVPSAMAGLSLQELEEKK